MKLTFMRNQIELKFKELQMLTGIYAKGVGVEMDGFEAVTNEIEQVEMEQLLDELDELHEDIGEMLTDFEVKVSQLRKLYNSFLPRFRQAAENEEEP